MTPRSVIPADCAACRARVRTASPGSTPQRPCPTLRSTSTPTRTPASRAARDSASSPTSESMDAMTRICRANAATREHFAALTTSFAIRTSSHKPAAISASPTVAQVSPVHEPAASWRRAISGVLCALKCGRSRQGPSAKNAAIRAMLRSRAATSTTRAGVVTSLSVCGTREGRGGHARSGAARPRLRRHLRHPRGAWA